MGGGWVDCFLVSFFPGSVCLFVCSACRFAIFFGLFWLGNNPLVSSLYISTYIFHSTATATLHYTILDLTSIDITVILSKLLTLPK